MRATLRNIVAALLLLTAPAFGQQPSAAASAEAVVLDPAQLDRYAGYYQVGPRFVVRLYREDSHFYLSPVGPPQKRELVAQAPGRFAVSGMPLTISFRPEADGSIKQAIVNQAGRDIIAPRITEEAATAVAAANAAPKPAVTRDWPVRIATHRTLTSVSGSSVDYWASFTPDGADVVFSRSTDGGRSWSLQSVPAMGGQTRVLFERPGLPATRASIAPTGKVAFNAGNAIWVMNVDGGDAHAIELKDVLAPAYPSWYPDGRSIAFVDGARNIVFRADIASGSMSPVTRQSEVLAGMPSVSPDGRTIAFAGQKNSGHVYDQTENQIWFVDEAGAARPVEARPGPGRTPSWSPDGRRLAFESGRGSPDGKYAIFVLDADGSGLMQVTDYALNANHPAWSADGKRLVFSWGSEPGKPNGIAVLDLPE